MINLLYKKLDNETIRTIIDIALDPEKSFNQVWVDAFFERLPKDKKFFLTALIRGVYREFLKHRFRRI